MRVTRPGVLLHRKRSKRNKRKASALQGRGGAVAVRSTRAQGRVDNLTLQEGGSQIESLWPGWR
eukprot:44762-Pelagomonas_calceolata.AAC.1